MTAVMSAAVNQLLPQPPPAAAATAAVLSVGEL